MAENAAPSEEPHPATSIVREPDVMSSPRHQREERQPVHDRAGETVGDDEGASRPHPRRGATSKFEVVIYTSSPQAAAQPLGGQPVAGTSATGESVPFGAQDESDPDSLFVGTTSRKTKPSAAPTPASEIKKGKARVPSTRAFIAGGTSGYAPLPERIRRRKVLGKRGGHTRSSSEEEDDDDDDNDDDDAEDEGTGTRLSSQRRRRNERGGGSASMTKRGIKGAMRATSPANVADSQEDAALVPSSTKKRRRLVPKGKLTRRDREDLEEDLAILGSSSGQLATQSRTRSKRARPKRSAKEKRLELIRRRKAGEKIDEIPKSSSEDDRPRERRAIYDSESEDDPDDADVDQDETRKAEPDESLTSIRRALRPGFRGDKDDQDFVIDDEDELLGVPAKYHQQVRSQVPIEFTRHAHRPDKENLRIVVEWMVQNQINPAFARDDELYQSAFDSLDQKLYGFARSKFMSSSWKVDFVRALEARPRINMDEREGLKQRKCEACGRTNHPATFIVNFSGKPYQLTDFEEISDDENSSESDDIDYDSEEEGGKRLKTYDRAGNVIRPDAINWAVGKFCAQNAEKAHQMLHWRFNLNETVVEYLRSQGYFEPEQVVLRTDWKIKQRREYAFQIIAEMQLPGGQMSRIRRDFERMIINAVNEAGSGRSTRSRRN